MRNKKVKVLPITCISEFLSIKGNVPTLGKSGKSPSISVAIHFRNCYVQAGARVHGCVHLDAVGHSKLLKAMRINYLYSRDRNRSHKHNVK